MGVPVLKKKPRLRVCFGWFGLGQAFRKCTQRIENQGRGKGYVLGSADCNAGYDRDTQAHVGIQGPKEQALVRVKPFSFQRH